MISNAVKYSTKNSKILISFDLDQNDCTVSDKNLVYDLFPNDPDLLNPAKNQSNLSNDLISSLVIISVQDWGYGITDKTKEKLFKRFGRGQDFFDVQ